jgi:chemotaxis protein methyltransferase CheR
MEQQLPRLESFIPSTTYGVLPLESIRPGPATPDEAKHFEAIRQWVYTHTGLHFPEQKHSSLYHRLQRLCVLLKLDGLAELDEHLHQRDLPGLAITVAHAVSTNHTYFFRERDVLKFFEECIVPTLPSGQKWRIWSAASASGEEAYTIAIILAELFGLEQIRHRVAILGTDISHVAIDQAEHSIYHVQRLDNVPPWMRQRYFRPVGLEQWAINTDVKRLCTFRRLNLMSAPWPFQRSFHVVLARNVLYYFDKAHQRALVERLYEITEPGGWLLTSVIESLHGLNSRWQAVMPGVYYKI